MENILLKLCMPDNTTIQQATADLRKALKNPNNISTLCQLIVTSTNPQVRQYAAVVLRRRYNKERRWTNLPGHIRTEFKALILQALVNEQQTNVKNAIAQLIAIIVQHEIPTNGWPEILQFMQQLVDDEDLTNKELGIYTLSIITEITPDNYLMHARSLVVLLARTLNSVQENLTNPVSYFILKTMKNLIPLAEHDQAIVNTYSQMMPLVIATIQAFITSDEERATECFDLLDELCEDLNTVIAPHVKSLVSMCLAIATNKSLDDSLRVRAVCFIGWLARMKKKALVKHKLVEPIVDMLFALMTVRPDNDGDDDYISGENDNSTPITVATQTLDLLALHLPPEKLIPHMLRYIEPGMQGTDIYAKKAAYVAIAVLAEGCCECIRSKYLESFLRCICQGITHPSPVVRNAALFALGQFSEHLQPEISQYSSELLPVLFEYLGQVCAHIKQEKKEPPSINRMFYALEMFCENLNDSLLPYLPTLMERLFEILSTDTPVHVRELALSAISSAACASKENMLPYFERIVTVLNSYLTENETDMSLQIQAVDTLAAIAKTIGEQHFAPLTGRFLTFGMKLLKETEDPDLRKSIYGLFASISTVMKKEMAMALPEIVEYMIMSIRSSDGLVTYVKGDEAFPIYEDVSEEENNEEEDIEYTDTEEDLEEDVVGVENAYIEEKEEAVLALKEIAQYTEEAFMPYLARSFEETFKLTTYPLEDIRKASVEALVQFCINFSKIDTYEGREAFLKALSMLVPRLTELIRLDEETAVAITAMDAYAELLKALKSDVLLEAGHKDAVMNCVFTVITGETECQDQEAGEDFETAAEQDELLKECAGEVLVLYGHAVTPCEFFLFFQRVLPFLLHILERSDSESRRSFASGTISDCFSPLKQAVAMFVPQLLPFFLRLTNDPSAAIRHNVIYGIGEMALYGKETVYSYYPAILQALSTVISKESHAGTRDNVVGAIARLIIANYSNLPLEHVFPIFIAQLPLKADFIEYKAVFRSILRLYEVGHPVLQPHIRTLLNLAVSILHEGKGVCRDGIYVIVEFIKSAQRDFSDDWDELSSEWPAEVIAMIQQRIFS